MWGFDRRLMSPVYDKTRPVPSHLMNTLGKPDFQQKYKALPVIPDSYNAGLENETYTEPQVNFVHQEYATGRPVMNPIHMATQNKRLINQTPTKLPKNKSNKKKKQKSVPEVSNPILGPVPKPLVPYNSDMKSTFTNLRDNAIANKTCVDRTFISGTVRDFSLYGKQSVIPGITQRVPNLELPRESILEKVQSSLVLQKTPVTDFNMQKTCLLGAKGMLETNNFFGKQSVIPSIAKRDRTAEGLNKDVIERVQSSQPPVPNPDKKLELETKMTVTHADVESAIMKQTHSLYGKPSVLPGISKTTSGPDEDNGSNDMLKSGQSKSAIAPNIGANEGIELNKTNLHDKEQVLPRLAQACNPCDNDYSTALKSPVNVDDPVTYNTTQTVKSDKGQRRNDDISDENKTGQIYERREFMREGESVSLNIAYSYESSPREESVSAEYNPSISKDNYTSTVQTHDDNAYYLETNDCDRPACIGASVENDDHTATPESVKLEKPLHEKVSDLMRKYNSVGTNIVYGETSPSEKSLSIFDLEQLDITEEGLSEKLSMNNSVGTNIAYNYETSPREKSLSVTYDMNNVYDVDNSYCSARQSNIAGEHEHTTTKREKPKCSSVSCTNIPNTYQENATEINQDVVNSLSSNGEESFKNEDESCSKCAPERNKIPNYDVIRKEGESLKLSSLSSHKKLFESFSSIEYTQNDDNVDASLGESYSDTGGSIETIQRQTSELSDTVEKHGTCNDGILKKESLVKERTFAFDSELNGETFNVNGYKENDVSTTHKDENTTEDGGSNSVHSISQQREQSVGIGESVGHDNTHGKASPKDDISIKKRLIILADPEHVKRKHRKRKAGRKSHTHISADTTSSTISSSDISTKLSPKEQNEKRLCDKTSNTTVEASDTDDDIIKVPDDILDEGSKSDVGSAVHNGTAQSVDCQVTDMCGAHDTSTMTAEENNSGDRREGKDTSSEKSKLMNMENLDLLGHKHVKRVTFAETPHIYHIISTSTLEIERRESDEGSNDCDTDEDIEHISDDIFDEDNGDVAIIGEAPIQDGVVNIHSGVLPELAKQINIDGKLIRPESKSDTKLYVTETRNVETQTTFTVLENICRRKSQSKVIRNNTSVIPRLIKEIIVDHAEAEGDNALVSKEGRSFLNDSNPSINETHTGDGTSNRKNTEKDKQQQGKRYYTVVKDDLNLKSSHASKNYKQIKLKKKYHTDVECKSKLHTSQKLHKPTKGDSKTLELKTISKHKYRNETQTKTRREQSRKSTHVIPDLLVKAKSSYKKGCEEGNCQIKYNAKDRNNKILKRSNKLELPNPTKLITKKKCSKQNDYKRNEDKYTSNQRSYKSIKKNANIPQEKDIHTYNYQNNTEDDTLVSSHDSKSSKDQTKLTVRRENERKDYNNIKSTDNNKTNLDTSYDKYASKGDGTSITTPISKPTKNSVNMNTSDTKIKSEIHSDLSTRCKTITEMLDNLNKNKMNYGLQYAYVIKVLEEDKYADISKLIADPTMVNDERMTWPRYKPEQLRMANEPNITAHVEDTDKDPSLYARLENVITSRNVAENAFERIQEDKDIGSGYICCYGQMEVITCDDTITRHPCNVRHCDTAKRGKPSRKLGDRIKSFFRNLVCIGKPKTDE